jgi:MFS family permease
VGGLLLTKKKLLDKFDQLNWIVTAYTLTSTAFIPTFGQIADIFGRHAALQLSMGFMLVGSTLAAAAQSWGMLLLGRALQGTSAAGIMSIIMIVLADKVSLKENAKNSTIFTLVSSIGYSVGPVIGG